jgi:hypothetical protein
MSACISDFGDGTSEVGGVIEVEFTLVNKVLDVLELVVGHLSAGFLVSLDEGL